MVQRTAMDEQKQALIQGKKGILGPFLSRAMRCTLFMYLALFVSVYSGPISASESSECEETAPDVFFALINASVDPYLPSLDRNGNTLLSEDEVFVQKSQHYYLAYKNFEPVSISMDRFAAMTEGNIRALENFESKITVLGPGCSEVNIYRNRLVGSYEASFDEIMEIISLGIRSENDALIQFASRQLKPKELLFDEMMQILGNDLALDESVVSNMLSGDLRRQFIKGTKIPLGSISEMALLAFSSMGGKITTEVEKSFIFVPKSFRGLEDDLETIMLASNGQLYGMAGFDYNMAAKVLNRLGIKTYVVTLSEVYAGQSGNCVIDMAKTWMQVVEGQKVRSCPFPELVQKMLKERTFFEISDFKNKSIVFEQIVEALNQ
jgi:hypothetical protein